MTSTGAIKKIGSDLNPQQPQLTPRPDFKTPPLTCGTLRPVVFSIPEPHRLLVDLLDEAAKHTPRRRSLYPQPMTIRLNVARVPDDLPSTRAPYDVRSLGAVARARSGIPHGDDSEHRGVVALWRRSTKTTRGADEGDQTKRYHDAGCGAHGRQFLMSSLPYTLCRAVRSRAWSAFGQQAGYG